MASSAPRRRLVAGFVDEAGELADPFGPGRIQIFAVGPGHPEPSKEWRCSLAGARDLALLRRELRALAAELGECKTLILGRVKGILPALMEELGVQVVEAKGPLSPLAAAIPAVPDPGPAAAELGLAGGGESDLRGAKPTGAGTFRLDLAAALAVEGGPTSKELLRPLLERGGFERLVVLCDHQPRWLDAEARRLGYGIAIESLEGESPIALSIVPLADSGEERDRIGAAEEERTVATDCSGGCPSEGGCRCGPKRGSCCG